MVWMEIKIKTRTEYIDIVSDILYDAGVSGVIIEDPKDVIYKTKNNEDWDFYDESILDFEYTGAIVKGYLPQGDEFDNKLEKITRRIYDLEGHTGEEDSLGEITIKAVYEEDWANSWKKYYKPHKIGETIVIKPSWEEYEAKSHEKVIELDPGMAFGTGTHETTSMCIKALEGYMKPEDTVFDIGCGSGILSIASAILGAKKVIGVDLDEVAVKVSRDNVMINHVNDVVEIEKGTIGVIKGKADIIVANIIAEVIMEIVRDIPNFINKDGIFISSGIINNKLDQVLLFLKNNNFSIIRIIEEGEWVTIISTLDRDDSYE